MTVNCLRTFVIGDYLLVIGGFSVQGHTELVKVDKDSPGDLSGIMPALYPLRIGFNPAGGVIKNNTPLVCGGWDNAIGKSTAGMIMCALKRLNSRITINVK